MEGEIEDILPIGSLDGTESGFVGNETQRDEPKTVVESDIYREYASLCEPHELMSFSGVKPSFDRTATDKRGKVPTIVVESDYEKGLNLPITFGSGFRFGSSVPPSFTRIAANQCVQEPKTVVESNIYREYASLCEPHESMLFSGVKPSFDRTATDKRGKVPTIVVESDYEKDQNLPGFYGSNVRPSFTQIDTDQISFGGYVRPSFTRIAANQCVQVGDMKLRQSVSSRRTLIMRPRDSKGSKDDDVEILEEEAVCKSCFAKLNSNDNTFKTSCGCGSVLIHENCVECWCRVVFENKNTCDKCGEEVQKQPVVLINDSIQDKSESSKRSWFSSLKR